MRSWKTWLAIIAAAWTVHAHAGEVEFRAAVQGEVRDAFQRGDFKAIEARYAKALSTSERTPSGSYVANLVRVAAVPDPQGDSPVPGRDDHWVPVEKKLAQWGKQFPQSSLVAVAQASAYVGHGFAWRGGGYARSVSPEDFKKLDEYVLRAYEALMARESAGRRDPYWYVEMLDVARLQSWPVEPYMALVRAATQAFPLNNDIYYAVAYRLLPRWGGSTEALANFADYAVKQTRKSEGESLYGRIYWVVGDRLDTDLGGPDVNWKRVRAGFDDIIQRYPEPWNLNHYARMACKARDFATARRVLLRIKDDVVQTAWPDRATYIRCRQAAAVDRRAAQ